MLCIIKGDEWIFVVVKLYWSTNQIFMNEYVNYISLERILVKKNNEWVTYLCPEIDKKMIGQGLGTSPHGVFLGKLQILDHKNLIQFVSKIRWAQ